MRTARNGRKIDPHPELVEGRTVPIPASAISAPPRAKVPLRHSTHVICDCPARSGACGSLTELPLPNEQEVAAIMAGEPNVAVTRLLIGVEPDLVLELMEDAFAVDDAGIGLER